MLLHELLSTQNLILNPPQLSGALSRSGRLKSETHTHTLAASSGSRQYTSCCASNPSSARARAHQPVLGEIRNHAITTLYRGLILWCSSHWNCLTCDSKLNSSQQVNQAIALQSCRVLARAALNGILLLSSSACGTNHQISGTWNLLFASF